MGFSARRPAGFTLIELSVSLAVTLIVTAAAMNLYLIAIKGRSDANTRAKLMRDAQLVLDHVEHDLRFLGVGIPRACSGDSVITGGSSDCGTFYEKALRPPIRIGTASTLVFAGDLPYPNADLTGISNLAAFVSSPNDEVFFTSELSTCIPCESGTTAENYNCDPSNNSLVLPAAAIDCNLAAYGAPTCPWGLNKWWPGNLDAVTPSYKPLLLISGFDGRFFLRKVDKFQAGTPAGADSDVDLVETHFSHAYPAAGTYELVLSDLVQTKASVAWASTPDIVYWVLDDGSGSACPAGGPCTLWRRQCWGGNADPSDANFVGFGNSSLTSSSTIDGCTAGTAFEKVMPGIKSLTFRYFLDSTTEFTSWSRENSSKTHLVEVAITLEATVNPGNKKILYSAKRRVFLDAAGGIINDDVTLAEGGCYDNLTTINDCMWD